MYNAQAAFEGIPERNVDRLSHVLCWHVLQIDMSAAHECAHGYQLIHQIHWIMWRARLCSSRARPIGFFSAQARRSRRKDIPEGVHESLCVVNAQRRFRSQFHDADVWREPDEPQQPQVNQPALSPDDMEFYQDDLAEFIAVDNEEERLANEAERLAAEEKRRQQQQAIRDELDSRQGRLWSDPWELKEEDWSTPTKFDDLPEWDPSITSRISLERVKLHPGKEQIDEDTPSMGYRH